jgi:5-(carboxyamino)imidazole ribonucleotide mutase
LAQFAQKPMSQKAVVVMGSKSDMEFCQKIQTTLSGFSIETDLRIASAHRTPEFLLKILREYKSSGDQIVVITVAGLSDALSGVVAAQRFFPVVACPPDLDKYDLPKVFSSAYTPSDVPVAFVSDPVKAGNFVAQMFALSNKQLAESILKTTQDKRTQIEKSDEELNRTK